MQNSEFHKLLIRMTYCEEMKIVKFDDDVLTIFRCIIDNYEYVDDLFIQKGLIVYILNLIFSNETSSPLVVNK